MTVVRLIVASLSKSSVTEKICDSDISLFGRGQLKSIRI